MPSAAIFRPAILLLACYSASALRWSFPNDTSYDTDRANWNFLYRPAPVAIGFAGSEDDVVTVLQFAVDRALHATVRSGRHAFEPAYSLSDGGVVVDVGALNSISFDPKTETVVVGPGTRLFDLTSALWNVSNPSGLNYMFPGGTCPAVAVAGLVAGGGFGFSSRLLGLASDSVVELRVAIVNGRSAAVVTATATNKYSDLFWAMQGAGSVGLGVITSLKLRAYAVQSLLDDRHFASSRAVPALYSPSNIAPNQAVLREREERSSSNLVTIWEIQWPDSQANQVVVAYQKWIRGLDARVGVEMDYSMGWDIVSVNGIYYGPMETMRDKLQPLLAIGSAWLMTLKEVPYYDTAVHYSWCPEETVASCQTAAHALPQNDWTAAGWKAKSFYAYSELSDEALAVLTRWSVDEWKSCCKYLPGAFGFVAMYALGGELPAYATDASAFPHRRAVWHVHAEGRWSNSAAAQAQPLVVAWARGLMAAMKPYLTLTAAGEPFSYRNYPDFDITDPMSSYFGSNAARVQSAKSKYDPKNIFLIAAPKGI